MCNLYSMTRSREAVRGSTRALHDRTSNQPPLPAIFPDQLAPVVRVDRDCARSLEMMRWGFPPPPKLGTWPMTDVRNTASSYRRAWLKPEFRCLVPATSFCEHTDSQPKLPRWFALGPDRPIREVTGETVGVARLIAEAHGTHPPPTTHESVAITTVASPSTRLAKIIGRITPIARPCPVRSC
jgi:putative SOS response-associated peptidase YedK